MVPPDTGLPVEATIAALREALTTVGLAVLQAPPGAGKTTVVPLRLLDEPWLAGRRIVVLEPRRLATRAAARRMASLLGGDVGGTVGFTTRDERRVSAATRVEVVTEGVLTRRLQHDPELPGTGLVVFDEHHERNLQGDLGLALALDVRGTIRPDLRLVVMSATLDGERVARLLGGAGPPAPIVASEGRVHPVEVRWLPSPPSARAARVRARIEPAVAAAVEQALRQEPTGDVLVFLPGAGEIRRVEGLLAGLGDAVDVRPLYGAMANADQDAALQPSPPGRRKVVLATDIAETSLTVEGVRVVVDSGQARVPRYDPRTGMTALHLVAISKASAEQRTGRAGRTGPGVAYRLWSKVDHAARRPFAAPEISQVDLAPLVLELAAWGDATGVTLSWLDPPPPRPAAEGRQLLVLLGALDADGRPTALGRRMADLPLHPRLARMVVVAAERGRGYEACVLAALLEERDVLRGHPDELPVDVAERVALLVTPGSRHPLADRRALRSARDRVRDLARRARVEESPTVDPQLCGAVLALAYPERVAQARGGGRFRLRGGPGAWVPGRDPLATETFLVAAEVDAGSKVDGRIRVAAVLAPDDLPLGEVVEATSLTWDRARHDLVARVTRRLGALDLGTYDSRPTPGPATTAALLTRVRAGRLVALTWTPRARSLQARVSFLRRHQGDDWPDLADAALLADLDGWLTPLLTGATGRADLESIDVAVALRGRLSWQQAGALDALAPASLDLRSGRSTVLDYGTDPPSAAVRVQQLFGVTEHPTVAGVPVVLHLLSPADRPVQVTSDLPGFWAGSWHDVRKAMAGRYPKHPWPEDPRSSPG